MERRRVSFKIGVTYQTPPEKLQAIPGIIKEIISNRENVTFDRAHLSAFADSSLNFEIVYFVEIPDLVFHMDQQQEIFLSIVKKFSAEGIEFAYPTQTVYEYKLD
jgi:small-conductance mechanosensitive channel